MLVQLEQLVQRYDQIPWLNQMRGIVRSWWNIEVIYIDKQNQPVFIAGQPERLANRLCATCLARKRGRELCLSSMVNAQEQLRRTNRRTEQLGHSCHLGMSNMVVPIFVEDKDGGMIYTTGFRFRELSAEEEDLLLAQARRISDDLAAPEALSTVPTLDGGDIERLADILRLGVSAVVTLFYELRAKEEEIEALRTRLQARKGLAGLVGSSSSMQEVYRLTERVAANDCTVLIRGESGTGKELVANAIHSLSDRGDGPFVVQNCSAFNDNLLESELFGHVRGAFTGAVADKKGLFEIADKGTLFLDEVAEMSPALQAKLLRVLQDQTFWPVGATTPRRSNVRILAATHRDLEEMVKRETFREDLYYRLNVISIVMPPLRERRSDIPALVQHFLQRRGETTLSRDALRVLCDYDWPGNVRELANEIERMTVLADSQTVLGKELISPRILQSASGRAEPPHGTMRQVIASLEASMIREALEKHGGNRSRAARALGMARSNLLTKMKSYGIG